MFKILRLFELLKTYGFLFVILRLIHKIFSIIGISWEVSYLLKQRIDISSINDYLKNHKCNYSIKQLSYNDFLNDDSKNFNNKKLDIIRERFRNIDNFIPLGIKDGNVLVYSSWLSKDKWELDFGLHGEKKGYILLLDDFCNPLYRNRGFHKYMIYYRLKKSYELGYSNVLVFVHWNNIPALKPQIKSGFEKEKICLAVQIFNKKKLYTFNLNNEE